MDTEHCHVEGVLNPSIAGAHSVVTENYFADTELQAIHAIQPAIQVPSCLPLHLSLPSSSAFGHCSHIGVDELFSEEIQSEFCIATAFRRKL